MRTLTWNGMTWVDLVHPQLKDLQTLQQKYKFHELDIADCLSEHERPKVDAYEDYLFIVIHVPYKDAQTNHISKDEVNIFVGRDYLITAHEGKLEQLRKLWERVAQSEVERGKSFGNGPGYLLYELTELLFQSIFPIVDDVNRELRHIEQTLFETQDQENMLRAIMTVKRQIISLRNTLDPQRATIASLEHKYAKFSPPEGLEVYFQNVGDAIEQETLLLGKAREVVDALQDTHVVWISHQTSNIIRLLTIFSVVLLPLTLITGLYGMNVDLPHSSDPRVFLWIVAGMLAFIAAAFAYAWRKKWL